MVEPFDASTRTLQKPGQGVVVGRRDRIELMIMAASTRDREPKKRLAEHIDLIVNAKSFFKFHIDRRVLVFAEIPKPRRDDGFVEAKFGMTSRLLHQITGDVLANELVVRNIGVQALMT